MDAGLFVGGALAIAVDPGNSNHILYGTDTRLLRSRNGGRDWVQEPGAGFGSSVFVLAMQKGGSNAVAAAARGVFHSAAGSEWVNALAPAGAVPAHAIAHAKSRLYLAAEGGLFASDDGGRTWGSPIRELPEGPVVAIAVQAMRDVETVFVVAQDRVWASDDGARSWQLRSTGLPSARIESLGENGRLWTVADGQVYVSGTQGAQWEPVGEPLPQRDTSVRGIAVSEDGRIIVLSTHRGVLRSADAGKNWTQVEGNLPVHLESGPLLRDPPDPSTLYVGFSLTPYSELRRRVSGGANLLASLDGLSLAGGVAFLALVVALGGLGVRWLTHLRARR
ncbi:MAG: WD40/YVTN/BNR-like repeat-containing protein [Burkholderiales bacterium]